MKIATIALFVSLFSTSVAFANPCSPGEAPGLCQDKLNAAVGQLLEALSAAKAEISDLKEQVRLQKNELAEVKVGINGAQNTANTARSEAGGAQNTANVARAEVAQVNARTQGIERAGQTTLINAGSYTFALQSDGNFVLYRDGAARAQTFWHGK